MIVMNDFKKEYNFFETEINKAITNTLESGWYILGKNVEDFERNFAQYIGTKYCIGVANGLEALQIALMALGIGKGDEVITVSNSAVATVLAITNSGAKPVFVDIDEYYLMDVEKIEEKITPRTKAIIPVQLFGQMANMKRLKQIAKKHNLKIIEDACQAHGALQNGKKSGSIGSLGCFSFYPTKNLGGYGDGGAITTNSKKLYEACKMLRNYGQKNRYYHKTIGMNSRLDELQAAILNEKLRHLDEMIDRRRTIADLYTKLLQGIKEIALPKPGKNNVHAYHLYVIRTKKRNGLQEHLKRKDIQSLIHYPVPIHKQECYREYNKISLPKTERFSAEVLSLPIHPFITEEEVEKVCNEIRSFFQSVSHSENI